MIEDPSDPHRGRSGRHHDRLRESGTAASTGHDIGRPVALADGVDGAVAKVGMHLARALPARLDLWCDRASNAAASSGLADVDLTVVDGSAHDQGAFARLVREADLAIMGAEVSDALGASRLSELTGRPCLAVPSASAAPSIGLRALVVWSDNRHAASALRDSLPLLRDAERILVAADPWDGAGAAGAVRYLEAHGFEGFETDARDLAETLRVERIDLLIVGAHQRCAHVVAERAGVACLISS